jgi:hypothetical protein
MFKDMKSKMATAMSAMIQPIDNVSYDLQTGLTGIKTGTGIVTFDGEELSKNPMDFFGMAIPAFAMLMPVDQVKAGDILVSEKKAYGFIQEITESGSLRTLNVQGHSSRFVPTKVNMMGISRGVTIVKSFTNLFGGNGEGTGGMDMSSLMMMSMLSGDGNSKMEEILPMMMLMGGMNGSGQPGSMNPLMLMMLMGDKNPFG